MLSTGLKRNNHGSNFLKRVEAIMDLNKKGQAMANESHSLLFSFHLPGFGPSRPVERSEIPLIFKRGSNRAPANGIPR